MLRIELLTKSHDRQTFDCGQAALNRYLQQTARQHIDKGIARTFVLVNEDLPAAIIGFFTLVLCELQTDYLPPAWSKKYPSTVPIVKLGRLAVSKRYQRQGMGEVMMIEAMKKTLTIAEQAGILGFFVEAKDEAAKHYYQRFGFQSLPDRPLEMYLLVSQLQEALRRSCTSI
jgi:GNAT superfamily N-acetyltransferase